MVTAICTNTPIGSPASGFDVDVALNHVERSVLTHVLIVRMVDGNWIMMISKTKLKYLLNPPINKGVILE